ncbi:thiolase family protein [Mycolicibacterium sp. P9-22]|uniref:thiolase family protein n=1 Tax=Mycolicibacterium sp. P9-22 TaxID=2024613 RepID=UPI0011ED1AEB|nr:thiolase family protein [Mycolicibacterium sp. P9-22]KAA0109974.1 thiolase family protein [Mycolicibacterium sp. P9-22]
MRYPIKDQTAIVGVASPAYARDSGRSRMSMVLGACMDAIRDAGLDAADIDGVCGSSVVDTHGVQAALGLPAITWWCNPTIPFQHQIIEAMHAIHAGTCTTVLCYHGTYRPPSRSGNNSPFRIRAGQGPIGIGQDPDTMFGAVGYAGWAARYLHEFQVSREVFGYIAINGRSNAALNPHAAMRRPFTMTDYLASPMVREPLAILDMDVAVDGADAFVITTAERARNLPRRPVLIHAAVMGEAGVPYEDQTQDFSHTGQQIAACALWERADLRLSDVDVFFPYDGFTVIAVRWFEAMGYCGDGEALGYFRDNWDGATGCLLLGGRVPVNTHGGSLSDGGTQGSGHVREAVLQLRGAAEGRQASNAEVALLAMGGMFFNSGAIILRVD